LASKDTRKSWQESLIAIEKELDKQKQAMPEQVYLSLSREVLGQRRISEGFRPMKLNEAYAERETLEKIVMVNGLPLRDLKHEGGALYTSYWGNHSMFDTVYVK
jgi:hypothetical protein